MNKQKRFAVILAGCGVMDGAEIHEATLTLLAIAKAGGSYECFAPDKDQSQVINHLTGKLMKEERNVLVEAARITRGKIRALNFYEPENFDAVIFPGGFSVAKNLSTLAFEGSDCTVDPEVELAVIASVEASIPIGALCIAPALIAKILPGADVTIGKDHETVKLIEKMGGNHHETNHAEVIIDEKYKLVTSPCYMLDAHILDIAEGTQNVVNELIKLM
ncbi:MAG: isoprenoid biosynthesis glyoxalase ElbB [Mariniphaga sp.]|nr:isoprenoid biosynthesis glyoxalase ElbB [Mariniphaga sp.]